MSSVPRVFLKQPLAVEKGLLVFSGMPAGCLRGSSKHSSATPTGDRGRVGSLPSRATKLVRSRIMKEIAELMLVKTPVYFIPSLPPRRHERVDEKQPQGFVVGDLANSPVRPVPSGPVPQAPPILRASARLRPCPEFCRRILFRQRSLR